MIKITSEGAIRQQYGCDRFARPTVLLDDGDHFPPPQPVPEIAVLTFLPDGALATTEPRHTPTDPIAEILGQSFAALSEKFTAANEARMRDIVYLFVTRLKALSLPPERVLVATKYAISSVGDGRPPSLADSLASSTNPARHRAYRRVFEWLLEAYFE